MVAPAVPEYVLKSLILFPETTHFVSPMQTLLHSTNCCFRLPGELTPCYCRLIEDEDLYSCIDARTDSLQTLRELGPPDLCHLVKQSVKAGNRQVRALNTMRGRIR